MNIGTVNSSKLNSNQVVLVSFNQSINLNKKFFSTSILLNFSLTNNENKLEIINLKKEEEGLQKELSIIDNDKSLTLNYLENVKNIINNNTDKKEAQLIIERSWIDLINIKLDDDTYLLNRYSHPHRDKLINAIRQAFITLNILDKNKKLKRKFPLLNISLNKIDYLLIAFTYLMAYHNKLNATNIDMLIGRTILFHLFNNNENDDYNNMTFKEFKDFFSDRDIFKLGNYFVNLISTEPHDIFEKDYERDHYVSYNNSAATTYKVNDIYLNEIKNNIIIQPSSLPMISEPNIWDDDKYGGYYINDIQQYDVITGSSSHNHKIVNRENLYKAINTLNKVKFSINKSLFNFLKSIEGINLMNLIECKNKLQQEITLKIAETYYDTPFYLPTIADWRGRIYTQSTWVSYQGGDLSSALLNFVPVGWVGDSLTEKGKYYLYIYGANNHNENNISKQSFNERYNWVLSNYNKIISLDLEFISKAENPYIFLAFCLNLKELHKNPNTVIRTPIYLDATCSGIQHLSALLQDLELGTHVNLVPYNEDKPNDIYSEIVTPINNAINKFGEENIEYSNFTLIKLNRRILKESIMTKVYNVTNYGIVNQIKSKLESKVIEEISDSLKSKLKNNKKTVYICPIKNRGSIFLNSNDIFIIAKIINDQIFVLFPSLNGIYNYFIEMTKLMIKLSLPLNWITPNGLIISPPQGQFYCKSVKTRVPIRFAGKNTTRILKESTNILDKAKQTQAIIPNIIHSLDANHLINLINSCNEQNFGPIITIHDCFGTLPNKMADLEFNVKREFILLYSNTKFLETFHNRIIQNIKDNNFNIITCEKTGEMKILDEQLEIKIPKVPILGKLDLQKIINAKYINPLYKYY
jgi:DNA-directed RNA polymerase